MPPSLRTVWTAVIQPADYDAHMSAIGQAQANAAHLQHFLQLIPPSPNARLLIAGAGTGQIFDYLAPGAFAATHPIFTDINPAFLAALRSRHPQAVCLADDLENTALQAPFHAAFCALVLEHIDWQRGLDSLLRLAPRFLYLVIQQNPAEIATAVTPFRTLPGSMRAFSETHPQLRDPAEIAACLQLRGYTQTAAVPRPVADNKTMLGLLFTPSQP